MPHVDKEWFDPLPRDFMALFYLICFIYIAIGIYILAKHFIVPSLDIIMAKTEATDSVAGTLIFGGATSVLGFMTSTIGAFVAVADGLSTNKILGGHVYDFTFMAALCILIVPASLLKTLSVRAFFRDIVFVAISTILIFLIFMDDYIVWYETLLVVAMFLLYLLAVRFLRKFMTSEIPKIEAVGNTIGTEPENVEMEDLKVTEPLSISTTPGSSCCETVFHFISLPAKIPFMFTIPSQSWKCCNASHMAKLYPLTLIVSFVWLGILSYLVIMIADDWGRLVGLPGPITGFFIAPVSFELMSSIILAKRGDLPIAIHAIIGRAVINLCLTFGIPTLIYNTIFGASLQVGSEGSIYSLIIMLLAMIVLILEVVISKGKLKKAWGIIPLVLFIVHMVAALALTYEFIKLPF